jgi:tRNA U34 5-methylaminomethyl-2-thiouridine-forming methyltransferase MnmC
MEPTLVITEDGSSTIFIAALDEHYHSVHGAIQESVHVFINAGLLPENKQHHRNQYP